MGPASDKSDVKLYYTYKNFKVKDRQKGSK